jgi:hypothetical protein
MLLSCWSKCIVLEAKLAPVVDMLFDEKVLFINLEIMLVFPTPKIRLSYPLLLLVQLYKKSHYYPLLMKYFNRP